MRKYTELFVAEHFGTGRSHTAVCPFPGKYPLRFHYQSREGSYHGKFHAGVWREFARKKRTGTIFRIYDKAGIVCWGANAQSIHFGATNVMFRYFGRTGLNWEILSVVVLEQLGPYRAYVANIPGERFDRAHYVHYVNSNVPHLRTV